MEISVENIKCGGCASGIRKALLALPEVTAVDVNIETGVLNIALVEDLELDSDVQQSDNQNDNPSVTQNATENRPQRSSQEERLQQARQAICQQLLKMGYPETGSVQGLSSAGAKAKSFVSCAVGKMHSDS